MAKIFFLTGIKTTIVTDRVGGSDFSEDFDTIETLGWFKSYKKIPPLIEFMNVDYNYLVIEESKSGFKSLIKEIGWWKSNGFEFIESERPNWALNIPFWCFN